MDIFIATGKTANSVTRSTLAILLLAGASLVFPVANAGEHGGGIRPCKPPKCGKIGNSSRNSTAKATPEVKPSVQSSEDSSQPTLPRQREVNRLSNDEQFPGAIHKLSNDEQFPSAKH